MTEYAASDRAICKLCKKKIYKDSLKLAYIIYSGINRKLYKNFKLITKSVIQILSGIILNACNTYLINIQ